MVKELRRSGTDVRLCGVCGGIGEYLGIDPNVVRLVWVGVSLFAGVGVLLYFVAAVLMPKADSSCDGNYGPGSFGDRNEKERTGT